MEKLRTAIDPKDIRLPDEEVEAIEKFIKDTFGVQVKLEFERLLRGQITYQSKPISADKDPIAGVFLKDYIFQFSCSYISSTGFNPFLSFWLHFNYKSGGKNAFSSNVEYKDGKIINFRPT